MDPACRRKNSHTLTSEGLPAEDHDIVVRMELQRKFERLSGNRFFGVPVLDFEKGGREQLAFLRAAGLNPDSKVVRLGCGVLRAGYWLIRFLDIGGYFGIEPHRERLQFGVEMLLEPAMRELKRARFDTNPHFDTSVFGEKFDFFLAYSVWTHASKAQIQAMLESFTRDAKEDGVFLTTYLPANWRHPDYKGDRWYGTSHESDVPGCIHHSRRWIESECDRRNLLVRSLGKDKTHRQSWFQIARRNPLRQT